MKSPATSGRGRLGLGSTAKRLGIAVVAVLGTVAVAAPAQAAVSAGRNLELNHSIDFAVLEGWNAGQNVRVDVVRGTTLIATKTGEFAPDAKVGGLFEINHVGAGDCWDGVPAGRTPDVKPGDKVVATVLDGAGLDTADINYFFVRNIVFDENADGTVTGIATGQETAPGVFDINARINPDVEVMAAKRIGSPVEADYPFTGADLNGSGVFTNVEVGGTPNAGDLFIDHLDETGGGTGTTTVLRSAAAGAGPCGPLVTTALSSVSHSVINLANVGTQMLVGGPRLAPTTVTAVTFGGNTYPADNSAADTWSALIPAADLAALANNQQHQLTVSFSDGAPNETRLIAKDVTAPVISAERIGDSVALSSNGGEVVRYTTDGSAPGNTSKAYDGTRIPLAVGLNTVRALATDAVGNPTQTVFQFTVAAPAGGAGGGAAAGGAAASGAAAGGAAAGGATGAIAPAGVAPGGTVPTTAASLPKLSLKSLSTSAKIKRSNASRQGIRLSMNLGDGTKVVKINIYRKTGTKLKLISSGFKTPSKVGKITITQSHATLRRLLRAGSYQVRVTPGRSKTDLGNTSKVSFKVVR